MTHEGKPYLKSLYVLKPWKSIGYIALEWLIICTVFFIWIIYPKPFLVLLFIPLMGTRMYALYSLLHDGIHGLLWQNRFGNDLISKIFLAWPIFISFEQMKNNHLAHHKYMGTERDPEQQLLAYKEFQFPMQLSDFLWIVFKDLSGYNFIYYKWLKVRKLSFSAIKLQHKQLISIALYYGCMLAILYTFDTLIPLLLLWIIPYCTVFPLMNRLRAYTEHHNIPGNISHTRTLQLSRLKAFFWAPYHLGYHTEHHMYPAIPNYNLPLLNEYLTKNNAADIYVSTELYPTLRNIWNRSFPNESLNLTSSEE